MAIMLVRRIRHRKAAMTSHAAPVIRALFFDAAGTLIEPAEPVADIYARTAAVFGRSVEMEAVKRCFGAAFSGIGDPEYDAYADGDTAEREWWRLLVRTVFTEVLGHPQSDDFLEPCFNALFAHYAEPSAWCVFPEAREVLTAARAAGWKLAVVSNFDRRLHGILAGHGLRFDAVITSADACARKPDPAIFQVALDRLGLAAGEVLHAGDSPGADFAGAASAGIRACLIRRPACDLRDFLGWSLDHRGK